MPADVPPPAGHTLGQLGTAPAPRKRRRRPIPPGLLRRKAAARYCGAGVSTWDRWSAAGLTPAPVRVGEAVLWSRAELGEWCRHGCPDRTTWTPTWQAVVTACHTGRAR